MGEPYERYQIEASEDLVFRITIRIVIIIRRNYALGYLGKRAVGEELNQLLRDGCHVFHDYPAGPKWNIDHIIVAPSGVYAVETKARRKRRALEKADAITKFSSMARF